MNFVIGGKFSLKCDLLHENKRNKLIELNLD